MNDIVIHAEGLGKKYLIGHQNERERYIALRDVLERTAKNFLKKTGDLVRGRDLISGHVIEEFWALKDVTFEVKRGEVLGIIGRNGAGKSTLLKILSRITEPSEGRVTIRGRAASLLEVGTGFHPELTGRENIFLNGAILGMRRAEIKRKFDEIVAFAEVERFLDTPVKRYSSGMYVRLAFAVAAYLDPEILIVDEVLAVGDADFQKKCLNKMSEVATGGRTVLFVSHNLGAIANLASRCLLLEAGKIGCISDPRTVISNYLQEGKAWLTSETPNLDKFRREKPVDSPVEIVGLRAVDRHSQPASQQPAFELGNQIEIEITLAVRRPLRNLNVTLAIKSSAGEQIAIFVSWDQDFFLSVETGMRKVLMKTSRLPLAPGNYLVDVGIDPSIEAKAYDAVFDVPVFSIVNRGQVTYWQDRPWGVLHGDGAEWQVVEVGRSAVPEGIYE